MLRVAARKSCAVLRQDKYCGLSDTRKGIAPAPGSKSESASGTKKPAAKDIRKDIAADRQHKTAF